MPSAKEKEFIWVTHLCEAPSSFLLPAQHWLPSKVPNTRWLLIRFCSPTLTLCFCYQQYHFVLAAETRWPQHEARAQQPLFFPFSKLSLESITHTGHSLARLNENHSMLHTCRIKLDLSLHSIQTPFPFSTGSHEIITRLLKHDSREDLEGTFRSRRARYVY